MTASSTQPSVPAPDKGKPELLIVADDDTDIARFVEMNLKLQGYEVIVANDGATALALIQEHQPALAIVDLMMPNIDGIELTRRLRANPLTAPMPIIMLTARGQTADKVVGLTAGADDYLVKPFDTLELVARVRSTLRRNQEYREISPLTGAAPGAHLEPVPEQHERGQHRGRLVEHLTATGQRHDQRVQPARADRHR